MSRRAEVWAATGDIQAGDEFAHRVADADSLKVGMTDRSMLAPAGTDGMGVRQHRGKDSGAIFNSAEVTASGTVQIAAQIMMTLEYFPERSIGRAAAKFDARSPKPPPCERPARHVQHPVRLQPLDHILMARDCDKSFGDPQWRLEPYRLRSRRRGDFRDGAIHHAAELIECDDGTAQQKRPCQLAAKLFAVAEHRVRLEPCRGASLFGH